MVQFIENGSFGIRLNFHRITKYNTYLLIEETKGFKVFGQSLSLRAVIKYHVSITFLKKEYLAVGYT